MALVDILLPPACAGCGRFGSTWCSGCDDRLRPATEPDDRFVAADHGCVLGVDFVVAVTAFAYDGPLRKALSRLKYTGTSRAAEPLADRALPTLDVLLRITGPASLVPVPVHLARERERGFNQAELLARRLASRRRLPVAPILSRARATEKQHALDRAGRLRNLRGAFAITRASAVPAVVIVVDDIITTSATLEACAGVLRRAGADTVYGFAIAREV